MAVLATTELEAVNVMLSVITEAPVTTLGVDTMSVEAYTRTAAVTAGAHGGRVAGWFAAEGTILGDGRTWDQVRFNAFPSKAAFMAVVFDPARLEAQKNNREPAIADTYTMIVRPSIDHIADSIAGIDLR